MALYGFLALFIMVKLSKAGLSSVNFSLQYSWFCRSLSNRWKFTLSKWDFPFVRLPLCSDVRKGSWKSICDHKKKTPCYKECLKPSSKNLSTTKPRPPCCLATLLHPLSIINTVLAWFCSNCKGIRINFWHSDLFSNRERIPPSY